MPNPRGEETLQSGVIQCRTADPQSPCLSANIHDPGKRKWWQPDPHAEVSNSKLQCYQAISPGTLNMLTYFDDLFCL